MRTSPQNSRKIEMQAEHEREVHRTTHRVRVGGEFSNKPPQQSIALVQSSKGKGREAGGFGAGIICSPVRIPSAGTYRSPATSHVDSVGFRSTRPSRCTRRRKLKRSWRFRHQATVKTWCLVVLSWRSSSARSVVSRHSL